MLLRIPSVLDQKQLKKIMATLANGKFIDGKLSAGTAAQRVKSNEELDQSTEQAKVLDEIVMQALAANKIFRSAALPYRISQPFFARYTKGMAYGTHIDDPIMGGADSRYRSDIAMTVFLNNPDSYEGGELAIQTQYGANEIKLPAGDAVIYPASSLHQVYEIKRGQRLVAIAWIQSLVRDPGRREILFNLDLARDKMLHTAPDAEETKRIDHAYTNLVRMWSEV